MNARPRRAVLLALMIGLAAMFASSVAWRLGDHPLVRNSSAPAGMPATAAPAPGKADAGSDISALMRTMKDNPENLDAMLELGRIFAEKGDAEAAIEMLRRAEAAAPSDPRPAHLAGVQHAALGRWKEAADCLRRSIAVKDDASARFSLGVICRYHLGLASEARTHWEAAERLGGDAELLRLIRAELAKLD